MGIPSLLSTTQDCVSSLGCQEVDPHQCTGLPKGLLRVGVDDEGPGLPRADPCLSTCCHSLRAQGPHQAQVQHCRGSRALFAVLFKGQIPEQQLHPWSPGTAPRLPSAKCSDHTQQLYPLQLPQEIKLTKLTLILFFLYFLPGFLLLLLLSVSGGLACKKLSFYDEMCGTRWGPDLCREPNKWPRAARVPTGSAQAAQHHSQQSQLYQTHTQALALPDTKLTPRKQII